MITKKLFQVALLFTAVVIAGGANASTHYVDYATGNDSNAGASTGSPWKHAPGMLGLTPSGSSTGDGCSANCASYTPVAGDFIILKGGTVWPYTTAPWTFTWSGSSSSQLYGCAGTGCIYVGSAVGAGLPAWNNGTVTSITLKRDLGGWTPSSHPSVSCSGGGGSNAAATPQVVPAGNTDPNIAGFIYHVSLTNAGSGYTSAPTCTLTGGSGLATLVADINRPIFDLGGTQGSPPDWPAGQCGSYPNTCEPGLNLSGDYITLNSVEVRNMRVQAVLSGGSSPVNLLGGHSTASNLYVHGMFVDCYYSGSCIQYDVSAGAVYLGNPYDEAANNTIENGDAGFLGNSAQAANGICNTNSFCTTYEFGITSAVQAGLGPESAHGNVEWMNAWQLRFVGSDASGNDPFLSYNNELWLTSYLVNYGAHINSRYMQLSNSATLISYNNIVHSEVGGTSSQIQCGAGQTFYYFNEVQWNIGTGTQPYSADMNDAGGTGGCVMNLWNDTMYASNGGPCVNSQTGTNVTVITMQNLQCITTPSLQNPFWSTGITNSVYQNQAGSTTSATVQASSTVQSISTANGQGYLAANVDAPAVSSNDTVTFSSNANSANLTSLCTGYFVALCSDINGNARAATGGWQAGAYQFSTSNSSSTQPAPPTNLSVIVN
jgi:hypothetical protein